MRAMTRCHMTSNDDVSIDRRRGVNDPPSPPLSPTTGTHHVGETVTTRTRACASNTDGDKDGGRRVAAVYDIAISVKSQHRSARQR